MVDIALRLDGVSRYYGDVRAVDNLSLNIPSGAFVTLLGPSGCGKSTTLSLIAGLDRLDEGRILLGDEDITDTPPNERRMAMVFQNYALYPHLSAYDNIAFGLKLQHRPKDEIKQRVGAVAEALDITHLMKRKPGEMSGGQQQRVALARALVKEPMVFLLDEPFSNLDAGLRSRMRTEVKHLHLKLGTTSVFVTHDQEEAMSLSDLIAVMRDGKVVQLGHDPGDLPKPARPLRRDVRRQAQDEPRGRRPSSAATARWRSAPPTCGSRWAPWRASACSTASGRRSCWASGPRTCASSSTRPSRRPAASGRPSPCSSRSGRTRSWSCRPVTRRSSPGWRPDVRLEIGQTVHAVLTPGRVHLFDRELGGRIIH